MPRYVTPERGAVSFLDGLLTEVLNNRREKKAYQREQELMGQRAEYESQQAQARRQFEFEQQQRQQSFVSDENQLDRESRERIENTQAAGKAPSLLDMDEQMFKVANSAFKDIQPKAWDRIMADWDPTKESILSVAKRLYPGGVPRVVQPGKEAKKLYESIQDAHRDASTRFGGDYDTDSLQALAEAAFYGQEDVGGLEASGRKHLKRTPAGIAKQRQAMRKEIEAIDDSLTPALREAAVDEVIRKANAGEASDNPFADAIGAVKQNQFAVEVLTGMKMDPSRRAEEIDLARLNAVSPQYQFTAPEDGGNPTIQDVIVDAAAQGADVKQTQALLAQAMGLPSNASPVSQLAGDVAERYTEGLGKVGEKVGQALGVAGGMFSYAPAGRALADQFPAGSADWFEAVAKEYATNPMLGPNHPRTLDALEKAKLMRAKEMQKNVRKSGKQQTAQSFDEWYKGFADRQGVRR